MLLIVILIASLILLLASIVDLKTGEIPEKFSLGLIVFACAVALTHTAFDWNTSHIMQAVFWGVVGLAVGYLLFYLGQWGGGDVKVLAGVGCLLGYIDSTGYMWPNGYFIDYRLPPLATYFIDMAFVSTPYVVAYTLVLGLLRPKAFREYFKRIGEAKALLTLLASLLPTVIALYLGFTKLAYVYLLVPFFLLATYYMRTVEEVLLTKRIKVLDLRDWDILAEDLVVNGKRIACRRNIEGVTPKQVKQIKRLAEAGRIPPTIRVRWGVKFAPILFISLLLTIYVGNVLEIIFQYLTEVD